MNFSFYFKENISFEFRENGVGRDSVEKELCKQSIKRACGSAVESGIIAGTVAPGT